MSETAKRTIKGTTLSVELQKGSIQLNYKEQVNDGSISEGYIHFVNSPNEKNQIGSFSVGISQNASGTGLPTTSLRFEITGVGVEDHQADIIALVNEARSTAQANVPS